MTRGSRLREYLPTTFAERGVAVPFTTPALISARIRRSERDQVEYILANPSGGAGYYVMGWGALESLCRVTMHDRLLSTSLLSLTALAPRGVRRVARAVAATGAAGRAAAAAAAEADRRDTELALVANFELLRRLLAQAGVRDLEWCRLSAIDGSLRSHIRQSLSKLEPMLGANVDAILAWIEQLANEIAPVGFDDSDGACRSQLLLSDLERIGEALKLFAENDGGDASYSALVIADEARRAAETGRHLLAACHADLNDVQGLVRRWGSHPGRVVEIFGRPDWLFDGWATICAIWETTAVERGAQREAICEIERLLPVVPKVVAEWRAASVRADADVDAHHRRWIKANVDWRSGAHVLERTARNESLRAYTA